MKAKARKTSTVLWCETLVIVKKAARALVTGIGKEVETALVPATGKGAGVGPLDSHI